MDGTGKVSGLAAGTATITVKAANGKSGSVTITVQSTTVESIVVTPHTLTLAKGASSPLTAAVLPASATNKNYTWSSSDNTTATVDVNGVVTAIKKGTAVITAITAEGAKTDSCTVTVTDSTSENVDGLTAEVSNSMDENHAGIVLAGKSAYIHVKLVKDGKPVSNTDVEFSYKPIYGNASDVFGLKEGSVKKTDTNGLATFVFGLNEQYKNITATDGYYQSYAVTVTAVGSSETATIPVSFACVEMDDVMVRNNIDPLLTNIVTGTNASLGDDGLYRTKSTNGIRKWQYVTNQQESLTGTKEHEVRISATPWLIIPAIEGNTATEEYEKIINSASGEYSVYNDESNTTTTAVVADVPAGLQYVTLYFSKLNLSEYTSMKIQLVDAQDKTTVYDTRYQNVTNNTVNKGVQIPIQENRAVDIIISLQSAGQVNLDSNQGYILEKVTGLWKAAETERSMEEELTDAVKWSIEEPTYSTPIIMSLDEARNYIRVDSSQSEEIILNEDNHYSYMVPTFPYSGDAIITVKDKNDMVLAYYVYPSRNKCDRHPNESDGISDWINYTHEYKNENVIAPAGNEKAIYVSEDEISKNVGTLEQEGNVAVVNSNTTGHTFLKAQISIPSYGQLDNTNGAVGHTSVQWVPRPTEEEQAQEDDFYALLGQTVEVEAQLYSTNGSVYTGSSVPIEFYYLNDTKLPATGNMINNSVRVDDNPTMTGTGGRAVLKVSASAAAGGNLYGLYAKANGYIVKLNIKENITPIANIHWVDVGLSFKDRVANDQVSKNDGITTEVFSGNKTVEGLPDRKVGTNWRFGYNLVGQVAHEEYEVREVSGIQIGFAKEGEVTIKTENLANGIVEAYSETAGATTIIGSIEEKSVNGEVVFGIYDKATGIKIGDFKNAGVGATTIHAILKLPISWERSELNTEIVSPIGTKLDSTTSTNVYIRVTDKFDNPYKDYEVKYSATTTTGQAAHVIQETVARTDSNGLVVFTLSAPETAGATTITAIIDGKTITKAINYTTQEPGARREFALVNAEYQPTSSTQLFNDRILLTFSNRIEEDYLNVKEFAVSSSDLSKSYTVKSAELDKAGDGNVVILTMDNTALQSVDTDNVRIKVDAYNEKGVEKQILDTNGETLAAEYSEVALHPNQEYKIEGTYDNGVLTVTVKRGNTLLSGAIGHKIYAVADIASILNNTGVAAINGAERTFAITPAESATSIMLYYMGAKTRVQIPAGNSVVRSGAELPDEIPDSTVSENDAPKANESEETENEAVIIME